MEQSQDRIASHVAIIMDGNGRWAAQRSLDCVEGHRRGVDALRQTVATAAKCAVKYLTVYAFSTENWGRPLSEVQAIMNLLCEVILSEAKELARNNIRLRFMGGIEDLSQSLQRQIAEAQNIQIEQVAMTLTVALNYSARWDIVRAASAIARAACSGGGATVEVDEKMFADNLSSSALPDVDLVIRTSGEQRLSNFMLWESSYAELYFTETLWPDFTDREFEKALQWYASRDRRYGKRETKEIE